MWRGMVLQRIAEVDLAEILSFMGGFIYGHDSKASAKCVKSFFPNQSPELFSL